MKYKWKRTAAQNVYWKRYGDEIKKWYEENGYKVTTRSVNVTASQLNRLMDIQAGQCPLCGEVFDKTNAGSMCVDHDHETGRIRGLLCKPCNLALGHIENHAWSMRALLYLTRKFDLNYSK